MVDPTINIGNILTIVFAGTAAIGFIWSLKGDMRTLTDRLKTQDRQLDDLQMDMKKIGEVLITLATQHVRLATIEERQLAQGRRLDEMIHRYNIALDDSRKRSEL